VSEPTTPPPEPSEPDPSAPQTPPALPSEPVTATPSAGGRQRLIGIGAGLLGYLVALLLAVIQVASTGDDAGYTALYYAIFAAVLSVVLIVAGVVLVVIERTRAFGAGVLIAVAIGVFCGGGICIGIAAGT
jgi:hypothetical protein